MKLFAKDRFQTSTKVVWIDPAEFYPNLVAPYKAKTSSSVSWMAQLMNYTNTEMDDRWKLEGWVERNPWWASEHFIRSRVASQRARLPNHLLTWSEAAI